MNLWLSYHVLMRNFATYYLTELPTAMPTISETKTLDYRKIIIELIWCLKVHKLGSTYYPSYRLVIHYNYRVMI